MTDPADTPCQQCRDCGEEPHTCPFKVAVGDYTPCNCCDNCRRECSLKGAEPVGV